VKQETQTVTFMLTGVIVWVSPFITGDVEVHQPDVPVVEGYDICWPTYSLDNGSIVVDAIVTPIQYVVSFLPNGGTGDMDSQLITIEDWFNPQCGFTAPANKHFAGWAFTSDGSVIELPMTIGEDVSLYAIWAWNEFNVAYVVDNETVFTDTFDYNSRVTVRDTFVKTGYTVSGWTTQDTDVTNGQFILGVSDVTFHATSSVNQYGYSVKYEDVDGNVLAPSFTGQADYGSSVGAPIIQITGYSTDSEASVISITELPSDNIVTYVYTINQYHVYYVVDNGTEFTDTFDYNSRVTVRDTFVKTGYTVSGWTTQDVQVEDGKFTLGAADVTFRATSAVNQYGYSVNYADASGKVLADPVSAQADYGSSVEAPVAQVTGYTAPAQVQTITVGIDEAANAVTYVYTINQYHVYYVVDNGTEFTDTFDYNSRVTVRDTFVKTGYTVSGWTTQDVQVEDGKFTLGAADVTFRATSAVNQYGYSVNYADASGKVLADPVSAQADYGSSVEAPVAQVTGYTAPAQVQTITIGVNEPQNVVTYVYEIITYTITFDDGTVQTQRTYTVENKQVDIPAVTHIKGYAGTWNAFEYNLENITVTANYVIGFYHVSFVSDGAVFDEYDLQYNATVTKPESVPTRSATAQYSYTFTGWNGFTEGMLMPDDDVSFTAEFSQSVNSYEISFVSENSVVKSDILEYGAVIALPAQPHKESSVSHDYSFAGWEGYVDGMTVTGEATFVASYDSSLRSYAITFRNDDGSLISSETKAYGSQIIAPAATKVSTAQYDFVFDCWNDSEGVAILVPATVAGEFTAYASYTENLRQYVITYVSEGNEFARFPLYYGNIVVSPDSEPLKASDDCFDYSFSGWQGYVAGSTVTGDATYSALFSKHVKVSEETDGSYSVEITDTVASFTAETISNVVDQAKTNVGTTMSVSLGGGVVIFDNAALQTLDDADSDLVLNKLEKSQMTSEVRDIVGDNVAFSITFGNNKTFGNGKVTVTVPYVLEAGKDADKLTIYYISDGRVAEEIPCLYNDGYVTFVTDHFSIYAVMYIDPENGSEFPIMYAAIGAIVVIALAGGAIAVKKRHS